MVLFRPSLQDFELEVCLPFDGWVINPVYCLLAGIYLKDTWLASIGLWSKASVDLLQFAMNKFLFGNNQHSEGVIKHIKHHQNFKLHTQEHATYVWWWFNNTRKCGKTLVKDYSGN